MIPAADKWDKARNAQRKRIEPENNCSLRERVLVNAAMPPSILINGLGQCHIMCSMCLMLTFHFSAEQPPFLSILFGPTY